MVTPALLTKYVRSFAALHRNQNARWGAAPHKPILLLAVLDGIDRGHITRNCVALTPELIAAFRLFWHTLVPKETWSEKIVYPYRYLVHDGFWTLFKNGQPVPASELGHPTSIGQFYDVADEGRFADDLWTLLQDKMARQALRQTLLDTYFSEVGARKLVNLDAVDPLTQEAEWLVEEARAVHFRKQPTPKLMRESDSAYLRHSLFPRVVTGLYDHHCAVCRLGIRDDNGRTLVDAAHILPFARFGNDDPHNGLALCPSHHRGFDAGWFSVSTAYTLLVSPRIIGSVTEYAHTGASLAMPTNEAYVPAPEALAWHREHVLLR